MACYRVVLALAAVVLGSGVLGQGEGGAPEPSAPPIVYCVSIGVTEYASGAKVPKAAEGAIAFAEFVRETYEGSTVRLLTDKAASVSAVNGALLELRRMPPNSLVLIYFAGHAERFPREADADVELFMQLYSPDPTRAGGDVLTSAKLWTDIRRATQTNVLVFLDCCFAGAAGGAMVAPLIDAADNGIKCFALAACSGDQSAIGTFFLESLTHVWKGHEGKCLTPRQLAREVAQEVRKRSGRLMTARPCFETGVMRCIAGLTSKANIVQLKFENARPGETFEILWEQVDREGKREALNPRDEFDFSRAEPCCLRQISRHAQISIEVRDRRGRVVAAKVIDPADYSGPFIPVGIRVREKVAGDVRSVRDVEAALGERAASLRQLARAGHVYGVGADHVSGLYKKAAEYLVAAGRRGEARVELAAARRLTPADLTLRAAFIDDLSDADAGALVAEIAEQGNDLSIHEQLRKWGRPSEVVTLGTRLAAIEEPSKDRVFCVLSSAQAAVGDGRLAAATVAEVAKGLGLDPAEVPTSMDPDGLLDWSHLTDDSPDSWRRAVAIMPMTRLGWAMERLDPSSGALRMCVDLGLISESALGAVSRVSGDGSGDIARIALGCGKATEFQIEWRAGGDSVFVSLPTHAGATDDDDIVYVTESTNGIRMGFPDQATKIEFLCSKPGFACDVSAEGVYVAPAGGSDGLEAEGAYSVNAKLHGEDIRLTGASRDELFSYLLSRPGFVVRCSGGTATVTPVAGEIDSVPVGGWKTRTVQLQEQAIVLRSADQGVLEAFFAVPAFGPKL